jgi:hypothetical protein
MDEALEGDHGVDDLGNLRHVFVAPPSNMSYVIEWDDGKIYRKALYLMVKTMVSCRFSLKPIQ